MLAKAAGLVAAGTVIVLLPLSAIAQPTDRGTLPRLTEASRDMCASPLSYHASQVEPMSAARGQMVVSTFQVGRVYDGGSCDIGWSTSMDGGRTWQTGLLPLTIFGGQATTGAGPLTRASDPAVAYDAQDGIWLIDTLGLAGDANTVGLFVNRSADGLNWDPPIATHVGDFPDKNWITCDNWPTTPRGSAACRSSSRRRRTPRREPSVAVSSSRSQVPAWSGSHRRIAARHGRRRRRSSRT
jgi:hypothetical protein